MANITKLLVNTTDEKIYVSATSTGQVVETATVTNHKFTNFKIDYTSTFNCSNEPSDYATTIAITAGENADLTDYEISFDNLLTEDPANDLFFIWLEETAVTTKTFTSNGFVSGSTFLYFEISGAYYRIDINNPIAVEDTVEVESVTELDYQAAYEGADPKYDVLTGTDMEDSVPYIYYTYSGTTQAYFKVDTTGMGAIRIAEDDFTNAITSTELHYYFGITLSVRDLYSIILNNIDIKDRRCCDIDCSSVDYILAWNGFNLAKSLGNYRQMIYYWKLLHNNPTYNSNCSCNG